MDRWIELIVVVFPVFVAMAIGGGARRLNWLTHEADDSLLKLVIRILMPCFIFDVLVGNPRMLNLADMWLPPVVGYGTLCLGYAVGLLFTRLLGRRIGLREPAERRTFAFCAGTYNWGYIPIPLVMSKFADDGTLGVLLVHNIGVETALWTMGMFTLCGTLGKSWWRSFINPPVLAIALSLGLNLTGLHAHIPTMVDKVAGMLGACAVPMGLLMIGATVADHFDRRSLTTGIAPLVAGALLRLALIPALFFLIAAFMPLPVELRRVVVIQAAMPAAVFPIVMAKVYGGDTATALRVVLGSSLVALITIPLCLMLALHWHLL